jgi:catechol 2,3-dioxygenase-like lactoylglutathione lyase family enzyme
VREDAPVIGRLKTVVLDAADMDREARFWSEVLDVPVVSRDDDWTTLEGRGVRLAVQLAPDHVPPQWPDPAHPQQLHLDVQVEDADDAERRLLALGARRLPDPEGAEDFRVFADPAGHPFCLVFDV